MRARASKHLYKFCEQFEIEWDHPIPLMLAWQQHRCHSVAFFMYISRAKFEEHCCNISGDILDSKKKRKTSLSNISFQVPFPCMQISHYINNCQLNIEMASFPFAGIFSKDKSLRLHFFAVFWIRISDPRSV